MFQSPSVVTVSPSMESKLGLEDRSIQALEHVALGGPEPDWERLSYGPGGGYVRGYEGSWNIPLMSHCAAIAKGKAGSRVWLENSLRGQLAGDHGFMGKEGGSRIYGPFMAAGLAVVAAWGPESTAKLAVSWLKQWFSLLSACSLEGGRWGYRCAISGMRSGIHSYQRHNNMEPMLAIVDNREVDLPKTGFWWPSRVFRSAWKHMHQGDRTTIGDRGVVPIVRGGLTMTRGDNWIYTFIHHNVNGNSAPTYAYAIHPDGRETWLHPDKHRERPGAGYTKIVGNKIIAFSPNRTRSMDLPEAVPPNRLTIWERIRRLLW